MINIDPRLKAQVQDYVAQGNLKHLHSLIGKWTPQELAHLLEELPLDQDAWYDADPTGHCGGSFGAAAAMYDGSGR